MNYNSEKHQRKKLKTTEKDLLRPKLNENFEYNLEKCIELYKSTETQIKQTFGNCSIEIINNPFKCCVFNDFIQDSQFTDKLRHEILSKVQFFSKNNDLYKFKQSKDLKLLNLDYCNQLIDWLSSDVLDYVQNLTGIELYDNQIDITTSKYEFTDTLLCHDDNIGEEERRVAFILYLVDKDWNDKDGGHLDLIASDQNQQPINIEISLMPKFNNFIFFEVCPISYHQVREVLSSDKIRLSVNGWFKGPKVYKIEPYIEELNCVIKCKDYFIEEKFLKSWINNLYLTDEIENDIKKKFEDDSQTMLLDFLEQEKFNELKDALDKCTKWKLKSPLNRRRYYVLDDSNYPEILKEFLLVMKSEQFFLILGSMTCLKLHELNAENAENHDQDSDEDMIKRVTKSNPRCSLEMRKFERGCYTLIHDYDAEVLDNNSKLDVKFYLNDKFKSDSESGGSTHYLVKNEDTELLTVSPVNNALSIVYRDEETVRFTKYLDCTYEGTLYELSMIFME